MSRRAYRMTCLGRVGSWPITPFRLIEITVRYLSPEPVAIGVPIPA